MQSNFMLALWLMHRDVVTLVSGKSIKEMLIFLACSCRKSFLIISQTTYYHIYEMIRTFSATLVNIEFTKMEEALDDSSSVKLSSETHYTVLGI